MAVQSEHLKSLLTYQSSLTPSIPTLANLAIMLA